jgi:hypothetical protein
MGFRPESVESESDNNLIMIRKGQEEREERDNDSDNSREQAEVRVKNRFFFNGEECEQVKDFGNGMILLRSINTGKMHRVRLQDLREAEVPES